MLAFQICRLPLSGRSLPGLCAGLCLALFCAFAPTAQAGAPEQPTHGVAMHGVPLLPPDFAHFPYAEPGREEGGPPQDRTARHLRQPQSLQSEGGLDGAGSRGQRVSDADDALAGRALHLLPAHRQIAGARRRPHAARLSSRPARAFLGWREAHRGRRALQLRSLESEGPPAAAHRLRARQIHRGARRLHGALRSQRREGSGIAADPRADAGAAETCDRRRALPGRDPGARRSAPAPTRSRR